MTEKLFVLYWEKNAISSCGCLGAHKVITAKSLYKCLTDVPKI